MDYVHDVISLFTFLSVKVSFADFLKIYFVAGSFQSIPLYKNANNANFRTYEKSRVAEC